MSDVLLRVLRRHTSLEVGFDEFFRVEMLDRAGQPDLNLSVFDVTAEALIRTHAEFVVAYLQPAPRRRRVGLCLRDCDGDFDATATPADRMVFAYARGHHVELRFLRESELRSLAEQAHREHAARERSASYEAVIAYGQGRVDAGDDEWVEACASSSKWKAALQR